MTPTLSLSFLAQFIRQRCVLPFHVSSSRVEDIEAELEQQILEEFRAIHAYVRTWQSSGAYPVEPTQAVQEALEHRVADVVKPWPTIDRTPVPERSDGRLVKSHPLDFPMGQGDFRQPRLHSTSSAFDYVQHKFRYFDGRFLSTLRGQRVTWALFNIALRENSHYVGSLVHKQCGQEAMTKAQLRQLLAEREDLVRRVTAFGADIPTTPMYWKTHGTELEWIVRQMSWKPCWCPPKESARKPLVSKVFRQRHFFDDEPTRTPTTHDVATQDAVFDDEKEEQDLLPCKEELWWDSDESSDDALPPNTIVKQEPNEDELDHADEAPSQ